MPRRGIVNVRMVITEEKILSNIEKVQRLINPNSKKQIIELDDNSYFKDLVESIKTYLIEYPKKKNFPKEVYDAAYELVEYATIQFEENTKQIESLIKQRENNIKAASVLKQTLAIVQSQDEEWKKSVAEINGKYPQEIIDSLGVIGRAKDAESPNYKEAVKKIESKVANLESNLHIEIDMERVEDRSKALSYIGIEVADALKFIPTPVADDSKKAIKEEPVQATANTAAPVRNPIITNSKPVANVAAAQVQSQNDIQSYQANTRVEVKESLWSKFKNSKFVRTIKYVMRIKVVLQLPEALPEANVNGNK